MVETMALTVEGSGVSGVPDEIRLLPLGKVNSRKGDMLVDDESYEMIEAYFKSRKIDLVVDYEHQTLMDVQAPAAGWIKALKKGADAIIGLVEWTDKAKDYLKEKEYRYLSPVVRIRKPDRRVTAIHSVALTNTPAVDGMFAICSDNPLWDDGPEPEGEDEMDIKELAVMLGLPEEATEADMKAAIKALLDAQKEEVVANSTILSLLELDEGAKTEDVSAKIMALKSGDEGMAGRLKLLEEEMAGRKADEAVDTALKAGKISGGQKDWAKEYALKDPDGFAAFVEKAPQVVPMGRADLTDPEKAPEADEATMAILKEMGFSAEDYAAYKEGK